MKDPIIVEATDGTHVVVVQTSNVQYDVMLPTDKPFEGAYVGQLQGDSATGFDVFAWDCDTERMLNIGQAPDLYVGADMAWLSAYVSAWLHGVQHDASPQHPDAA